MKKILILVALCLASNSYAQTTTATQQQQQHSTSASDATSISNGGTQGQQQGISNSGNSSAGITGSGNSSAGVSGITASNGLTVGCLVNCASTDQGSKDLASAQVGAATINADAARDIAAINAKTARDVAATHQVIKNTPSVAGPNLTTSNDTCMGSTSGSVNIAGLGIGGGTSWVDNNCKMLKNSRELWNMGMKAASLALMCTDSANREALELTGFECPQTTKARNQESAKAINVSTKAADQSSNVDLSDPYIRSRMGLKPLDVVSK